MLGDADPDDAALLAQLHTERDEEWRALAALDEDFRVRPQTEDDCVWSSGFPQYSARIEEACRLLSEVGAVTPAYPWMRQDPPDADGKLTPADAVRLATRIVRSERFGDGNIAAAVKAGALQAVVAALVAWHRSRPEGR